MGVAAVMDMHGWVAETTATQAWEQARRAEEQTGPSCSHREKIEERLLPVQRSKSWPTLTPLPHYERRLSLFYGRCCSVMHVASLRGGVEEIGRYSGWLGPPYKSSGTTRAYMGFPY